MSILEKNMKRYTIVQPLSDLSKETQPSVEYASVEEIERSKSFFDLVKDFQE
jgi:hypothetical protein